MEGFRGSVLGVPGEGFPGGKSGFRMGGVAKSLKSQRKSTKIGSGTPPGAPKNKATEKGTEKYRKRCPELTILSAGTKKGPKNQPEIDKIDVFFSVGLRTLCFY